jgi:hypothetical protein
MDGPIRCLPLKTEREEHLKTGGNLSNHKSHMDYFDTEAWLP